MMLQKGFFMDENILRYDHIYFLAATQIREMLDRRGFSTDTPEKAEGLEEEIADIVRTTLEGKCNNTITESTFQESHHKVLVGYCSSSYYEDGWGDDLQHQIT